MLCTQFYILVSGQIKEAAREISYHEVQNKNWGLEKFDKKLMNASIFHQNTHGY